MAIDTAIKRASIASIGAQYVGPSVVPDGTIGQPDRQVIGYSYSGIAAGGGSTFQAAWAVNSNTVIQSTGVL